MLLSDVRCLFESEVTHYSLFLYLGPLQTASATVGPLQPPTKMTNSQAPPPPIHESKMIDLCIDAIDVELTPFLVSIHPHQDVHHLKELVIDKGSTPVPYPGLLAEHLILKKVRYI